MSGSLTMWAREQMLTSFFRRDAFTVVPTVQVALCRALPNYTATSSQLVEPVASGYARQNITLTAANWALTGFGEISNVPSITFGTVGTTSWGLIVAYAIVDPVSGNCVQVGQVGNPMEPLQGMIMRLGPGMVTIGIYDDAEGAV